MNSDYAPNIKLVFDEDKSKTLLNTIKIDTESTINTDNKYSLVESDNPILRKVAEIFDFQKEDASNIAEILIKQIEKFGGIGLSACQIGMNHRVFVMGVDDQIVSFFNPIILDSSKETDYAVEGCLSFPNYYVGVRRPIWVKVRYNSFDGNEHEKYFSGLTARIFQHETDHLNGIIMKDHAGKMAKYLANKRVKKLNRKIKHYYDNISKIEIEILKKEKLQQLNRRFSINDGNTTKAA